MDACLKLIDGNGGTFPDLLDTENANTDTFGNTADESTNKGTPTLKEPPSEQNRCTATGGYEFTIVQ